MPHLACLLNSGSQCRHFLHKSSSTAFLVVTLAVLLFLHFTAFCADSASRPNLFILLADDMGYGDLGCFGCPDIRTPNIDSLAGQGVRLTSFYSNGPECSPMRGRR